MKKLGLFIAVLMVSFSSIAQRVVGYFPYYRSTTQANAVQYSKLTDVIYAFAQLNSDGSLSIMGSTIFDAVKSNCQSKNVKLWIAIGGWGLSGNFSTVAANANTRTTLANACLTLCQTHNLAGIDIDWEFPTAGEKANYTAMLKDIKTKLGSNYKLSAALGGEQQHTVGVEAAAFQYLDYFNIMSYDAPTSKYNNHAAVQFLKDAFQIYKALGCPVSKILGGSGFYSRCAAEATFADISASSPSAFYNDADGVYNNYCYDSKPTLEEKVDYVMQNGGNGLMIWELSQDRNDQYSLLSAVYNKMQAYQGPTCSSPTLGGNKSLCGTSTINIPTGLSAQSYRTFTWYKNGVVTGGNTTSLSVTSAGTYKVKVDSAGKCSKVDSVVISSTLGAVNLGSTINLCSPATDTLDAGLSGTNYTYVWKKDAANIAGATNKTLIVKYPGTYNVTVSASNCSSVNGSVTVTSSHPLVQDVQRCNAGAVTFNITNGQSGDVFEWYAASTGGSALATGTSYSPTISQTTTYYVVKKVSVGAACVGLPAWKSGDTYTGNQSCTYNNRKYTANWWTQATPGSDNSWTDNGTCGAQGCDRFPVVASLTTCLGLEEKANNFQISIVPNPVEHSATATLLLEKEAFVKVSIVNSIGVEIYQLHNGFSNGNELELAIPTLNTGIYFLKTVIDGKVGVKRFVVK